MGCKPVRFSANKFYNFPEFTGRVCPAPCEGACTLGINEPAVTIKANEYQIIEKAFEEGWIKAQPPEMRTGRSVAIVGSGPFLIMTKEIIKDRSGQVKGVKTAKIHWDKDEAGNFIPIEEEGTEKVWSADLVLIAMGFLGPEETLIDDGELDQDERSNVKAEYGDFRTSIEGVFAAGDMRRGQSLVVNAIDEGKEVAKSVDEYLIRFDKY